MKELRDLFNLLSNYKKEIILGLIFLFIVDGAQMVMPWVFKYVIDDLSSLPLSYPLYLYALAIVFLGLIALFLRYWWRKMIIGASRTLERDIRKDFYHKLMYLDSKFYSNTETGDIMAHATNDVRAVQRSAGFGVVIAADALFMGIVAFVMMLSLNKLLTLYVLTVAPFIGFCTYYFGHKVHLTFGRSQEGFSLLSAKAREFITGMKIIRDYVQEEGAVKDFDKTNREYFDRMMDYVKYFAGFRPVIFFLASIAFSIVLYFGGKDVISGKITLGGFVAFFNYLDLMIWPMIAIGMVVNMLQRGTASLKRLQKILERESNVKDRGDKKIKKGQVKFDNVTFSYNGKPVIKDINITFEPTKSTAIVGTTASGKSTIVDLIWRRYNAEGIYVDGEPIKELSLENLRKNIGLVPQTTILFSTSIRDNITFGNPDADEEEIIEASKKAEIYNEIMNLEEEFETQLGERGANLSGGQRQRLAIARALILDPPILILDDALSSVDSQTEKAIMENISNFLKKRTSIIISHRLSAIKDCDEIVVMDDGKTIERGKHHELIANGKLYSRLYEKQKLEELLK